MLLGKTITVKLIALVGVVLALGGCSGPYLLSSGSVLGVKLTLNISTPIDSGGVASSRLLLPSTRRVELTVEKSGTVVEKKTQSLATGSSSVTFQLDLEAGVPLTVTAKAYDASGTLILAGETPVTLTKNTSAVLSLLPVKADGSLLWPSLSATDQAAGGGVGTLTSLAAGASTTFVVDLQSSASAFTLSSLNPNLKAYALRKSGVSLGATGSQISRIQLAGEGQFLLTLYNSGTDSVSAAPLGTFTIPVKTVSVPEMTVLIGQSKVATLTVSPANASQQAPSDFTWTASNALVTVDASGLVTGVSLGSANVTATNKATGVETSFKVTVSSVAVTGVTVDKTTLSMAPGDQASVAATVSPSNATNVGAGWTTSNSAVATVNSSGTVTAVAPGSAEIKVTTLDGGFFQTIAVTVINPVVAVTGITLDKAAVTVAAGSSATVVSTIAPANATNTAVTWTSSNDSVATVTGGVITGVAPGTATVTATSVSSGLSAAVAVTVTGSGTLTLGILGYGALGFSAPTATIDEGTDLILTVDSTLAAQGTGWAAYVLGTSLSVTGTTSLTVDTSGLAAGQHFLDLFVTWSGVTYSGTLAFTLVSPEAP